MFTGRRASLTVKALSLLLVCGFRLKSPAAERRENDYQGVSGCGNRQLSQGVYWTGVARSKLECHILCQNDDRCVSVNVCGNGESETVTCSLSHSRTTDCDRLEYREGCSFSTMKTNYEDRCGRKLDGSPCEKKLIQNCKQMKDCINKDVSDGEYWIYPMSFKEKRAKIYCHNMSSDTPTEYVTLHEENYSFYPPFKREGYTTGCSKVEDWGWKTPGTTVFKKVRVLVDSMVIIEDDFTYSNSTTINSIHFGVAGDCVFETEDQMVCPKLGRTKINTNGTGLLVNKTLQWKIHGYRGKIESFERSPDGREITAVCGGWCGWCRPDGALSLQLDSTEPLDSNATRCGRLCCEH